ncbi:HAD-IC family P-type ATPase [Rhodoblastus acidophilus]|uniref:HAD-IC family P-type ATPase n=1 Tax=Candidatus Rhodoblastus alkanivorans TaxID=2954117 RepID=A0ABS9Z7Z8_9HYPH|nr:HAD-IC family P-type ATPase [Candidatus Rhodoblastus alkanivorans]MCI4683327.1 HAD-IC family P-type ATPase [Candidatus Rhodoblastus alkanivorans]MDI4640640.1 HAD-IC family P-type ATPase [Rhodoblastus acidophilus]
MTNVPSKPIGSGAHDQAGLSSEAARRLLAEYGFNEVAEAKRNAAAALLSHFWAPVPWMLEAAVLLQVLIREYLEAAVIGGLLAFNALLSFLQGKRAEAALAALKSRLALTASVRRDGAWVMLPAREIVPGDVVKLSLGAIVPADVRLVSGSVLLDQSMITGESLPAEAGVNDATYAGAMVRRGEAEAVVTATGPRTYSGRAAELVRIAHGPSAEQSAILRVVRNLAMFNGLVLLLMAAYARAHDMSGTHLIALTLTVILASVPVALPATFTLASALGAQRLIRHGVLPTRLSAVHDAAAMDVLCSDKTGTLTQNTLKVAAVRAFSGFSEQEVLALAAAASSEGGKDPVDSAVRAAAEERGAAPEQALNFVPFDPATKFSEALIARDGTTWRVVKGAFATVAALAATSAEATGSANELATRGSRVLAIGCGPAQNFRVAGLIALSDPPRADAAPLISELASLGVATVMVTGDAAPTAGAVARAIGLSGPICPAPRIPDRVAPADFGVFAGVFPEDKFRLVKAFQTSGHTVGMCGDGANDAPALRQAQIGIAVSTATDVAKSAAGLVLTEPGLGGIVAAVKEGRATFQRILTYTINALLKKIEMVLFLGGGLVMTGDAVLTPILMALLLVTNDFLTMSLTTDRARPSPRPEVWLIGPITAVAVALGLVKLAFSTAVLAVGRFGLGLSIGPLRTLAFFTMVVDAQATVYVIRERRRLWSSWPGAWVVLSSAVDLGIGSFVSLSGWLTPALPVGALIGLIAAAAAFALLLDAVKAPVLRRLGIV